METLDIEKQSIVLLTSYFKKPGNGDVSPLTPTEWKIFAGWLRDRGYTPGSLLSEDGENIIESWKDNKIANERLIALLKRGAQMSMLLEKWSRAGIWILTRGDSEYPQTLKSKLGQLYPPVLFGSGNKNLLNSDGIAVVGSRNISDDDLKYSKEIGKSISENNINLISGGAKGVDVTAMLGALENNGNAIGVLSDGLFQKSISQTFRKYLSEGNLAFVSPYYPDAGFNVGNAMGRNKYIYCLSIAAIVVHSGLKGGTWTGANENLKKKWVPLYVKENNDKESGNILLIKNGGIVIKDDAVLNDLISNVINKNAFAFDDFRITTIHEPRIDMQADSRKNPTPEEKERPSFESITGKSFYEFFILKLMDLLKGKEVKQKELKEKFDLSQTQLGEWLKRAEKEGVIQKLTKPVRYKLVVKQKSQTDLFG